MSQSVGRVGDPELVVLLDADGRATGTADKATVHGAQTPLHLAFSAYLFDDEGRLLLTQRAASKATFPGIWTNSVCGHPAPGESPAQAVTRRAETELGLQVRGLRLVLPQFSYRAEMHGVVEHELCPVFVGWLGPHAALDLHEDEVDDHQWVGWGELSQAVLDGRRDVSPWCRDQVAQLVALGDDPHGWPEADPALLPPAARG